MGRTKQQSTPSTLLAAAIHPSRQKTASTKTNTPISSPGPERFDGLLTRLRKSSLGTRARPAPSPRHALTKDHPTATPSASRDLPPHQQQAETSKTSAEQPDLLIEADNERPSAQKTSKSPLPTPKRSSCIVNLSSATPLQRRSPSDPPSAPPPAAESTHNKLDWASLVEAARQSDAEEDQLPDLTEWATKDEKKSSLQQPEETQPTSRNRDRTAAILLQAELLNVQSRSETSPSLGRRLVKIQLGGLVKTTPATTATDKPHNPPAPDCTPPSNTPSSSTPSSRRRRPAHNPPSSSRLLNQKQKLSIARLIIPVPSDSPLPSPVLSASTIPAPTATAIPSSTAPGPPLLSSDARAPLAIPSSSCPSTATFAHTIHSPRLEVVSSFSSCSSATVPSTAIPRPSSSSRTRRETGRKPPPRNGIRLLDPSGLRVVSDCLKAAEDPRDVADPQLPAAATKHGPDGDDGAGGRSAENAAPVGRGRPLVDASDPSAAVAVGEESSSTSTKKWKKKKKKKEILTTTTPTTTGGDKTKNKQNAQDRGMPAAAPGGEGPVRQKSLLAVRETPRPARPSSNPPRAPTGHPPSAPARPANPPSSSSSTAPGSAPSLLFQRPGRRARPSVNLFDKLTGGALLTHHHP